MLLPLDGAGDFATKSRIIDAGPASPKKRDVTMIRKLGAIALSMTSLCATGRAADTPHAMWLKAKCALCHGEDGAGNTPEGKRMGVPDMRSATVQKRTDAELTQIIAKGHVRMPSFKTQLKPEQIPLLVQYIRSIAEPK
jgi:cytochrome c553